MDFPGQTNDQERGRNGVNGRPWDGLSAGYVRGAAADRLRALGHVDRLRIVEVLARGPAHVGDIASLLGLSLATVSRHVRALHRAGIVESSRDGNRVLYVLSDRDTPRLAAFAYRGAAAQARRVIASAPAVTRVDEVGSRPTES